MKNKYHNLSRELITAKRPNQMLISAAITAIVFTATPSFAEQVPSVLPANVSALNSTSPSARVEQLKQEFMSLEKKLTASNVFYLGSQADASALHRKFRVTLITPRQLEALGTSSPIIIMADSRHVRDWNPLIKQIKAGSYVVAIGDTRPLKVLLSRSNIVTTALDDDNINEKVFGFHQTADKGDCEYSSLETDGIAAAEAAFNWARRNLAEQSQPSQKVSAQAATTRAAIVDESPEWKADGSRTVESPEGDWQFSKWEVLTKYYRVKNDGDDVYDWVMAEVILTSVPKQSACTQGEGSGGGLPPPQFHRPNFYSSNDRPIFKGCKRRTKYMHVLFEPRPNYFAELESYGPETTNGYTMEGWKIQVSPSGGALEYNFARQRADVTVRDNSDTVAEKVSVRIDVEGGTPSSRDTLNFKPAAAYKVKAGRTFRDAIKQSNYIEMKVDHWYVNVGGLKQLRNSW